MQTVKFHLEDRIARITLNRPEKRNALNPTMVAELTQLLEEYKHSDRLKVVVLQAEGKVFCAGADLAYLQQLQSNNYAENLEDSLRLKALFQLIYAYPKPVIAQVHGHALAGGCGLANVCDFVFSVPEAQFGYTEVRIGFVPAIVTFFLLRKLGEARAKEMLLSGDLIDAQTAYRYGLVNFLVEAEQLHARVQAFAEGLCRNNSAQSMALVKEMCDKIRLRPMEEALYYAAEMNAEARGYDDCKRGIEAFLNKEKLVW
jgi:methylglutaconyl-CoA hydratase